jgi:hypothetical protein
MRIPLITLLAGAALLAPAASAAQDLAARVNAAPAEATVRFTFDARPGVCGNGENISIRSVSDGGVTAGDQGRVYTSGSRSTARSDWLRDCAEGPVEMEISRAGGRITDAAARVGGRPRSGGVDLGRVQPAVAVAFLLDTDVLRAAADRAADRMVFAATLADAESWPGLLRTARDQQLSSRARKSSVFWLAQAAGDRATAGLRSIVGDDSDELEVRKQAVFALSQIRSDDTIDALIEIARSNPEPELRRSAMFWLGQSGSPRAVAFFEEVLRG